MSWQPDSDSDACTICSTAFTFFCRKHHCRKCGKLACGTCAGYFPSYPSEALVLHGDRPPTKPEPLAQYRTCESCALQLGPAEPEAVSYAVPPTPTVPTPNVPAGQNGDDESVCPVCGANLLQDFRRQKHADWDQFKEGHVSECITSFDFASGHLRLSSPPGASSSRNRMLVYNIPVSRPSQEGVYGSVTSHVSVTSEKEPSDNECVICLEDLNPGDKVGRLECLCVFHYTCIKDWFNKKSVAECPVHFLHR